MRVIWLALCGPIFKPAEPGPLKFAKTETNWEKHPFKRRGEWVFQWRTPDGKFARWPENKKRDRTLPKTRHP